VKLDLIVREMILLKQLHLYHIEENKNIQYAHKHQQNESTVISAIFFSRMSHTVDHLNV
jgi:hypothetical protein